MAIRHPPIKGDVAYNKNIMLLRNKILLLSLSILVAPSCTIYNTQSLSPILTPYQTIVSPISTSFPTSTKEFTNSQNEHHVDGRFVVYTPEEVDLVDPTRITNSKLKIFQEPVNLIALSPNGSRLAYLLNNSLIIEDVASHSINDLFENQVGSAGGRMGWSPDGSMIALTCATPSQPISEICLVNTANDSIRTVTNSKELGIVNPYNFVGFESWSNKGSTIVFTLNRTPAYGSDEKNDIYVLDLITGKINLILNSATQSDIVKIGWVSIAPDNETLLFHGKVNGNFQIFQINIDGSGLRQITDETGYDVTIPVWNSTGTLFSALLYNPQGRPSSQVVILDLSGKVVQRLNTSGFVLQWLK